MALVKIALIILAGIMFEANAQTTQIPCIPMQTGTMPTGTIVPPTVGRNINSDDTTMPPPTGSPLPPDTFGPTLPPCKPMGPGGLLSGMSLPPVRVSLPPQMSMPPPSGAGLRNPLASMDPELILPIRIFFLSTLSLDAVLNQTSTRAGVIRLFATLSPEVFRVNCSLTIMYYNWLVRQFIEKNEKAVTYQALVPLLVCKKDCNFKDLIDRNFTDNRTAFALDVRTKLNQEGAAQCAAVFRDVLPTLRGNAPLTSSQIISGAANVPLSSVINPGQLRAMAPAEITTLIANPSVKLDDRSKTSLGAAIPPNATIRISDISSIIAFVSSDLLINPKITSPADLASNAASIGQNRDRQFLGVISTAILKTANASVLNTFISNALNSTDLLKTIPLRNLRSSGVSIPVQNQPPAMLAETAKNLISQSGLEAALNSTTTAQAIAKNIKASDFSSLSSASKANTVQKLADSVSRAGNVLDSTQRKDLLDVYTTSKSASSGKTKDAVILDLSSSEVTSLATLLADATESILTQLSSKSTFASFLTALSSLTASQCNSFTSTSRKRVASVAIKYLTSGRAIDSSDLDTLGPCFAPFIPSDSLNQINASDFKAKITYFTGSQVQYDRATASVISTKISVAVTTSTTSASSTLLGMGDLVIFGDYKKISCDDMLSYGGGVVQSVQSNRNSEKSILANNGMDTKSASDTVSKSRGFMSYYSSCVQTKGTSRRKRAASALTCSDISTYSLIISSLDVSYISTISSADFKSCIDYFGDIANTYSSEQLAAIKTLVETSYGSDLSTVSDTDIGSIKAALLGFSASSLAKIKFTTYGTLKKLGTITQWSSDQLTSLASAAKSSMAIDNDLVSNMGNIACGLTDFSVLSSSQFSVAQASLSQIASANCPGINAMYNQAKTYGFISTTVSSLTDWSYVSGGISTSDIASVASENIPQLPMAMFTAMPAATVNSLSVAQLSKFSTDQVSTLIASSQYSSFNTQVTSALRALSTNSDVTVVTSGSANLSINVLSIILSTLIAFHVLLKL